MGQERGFPRFGFLFDFRSSVLICLAVLHTIPSCCPKPHSFLPSGKLNTRAANLFVLAFLRQERPAYRHDRRSWLFDFCLIMSWYGLSVCVHSKYLILANDDERLLPLQAKIAFPMFTLGRSCSWALDVLGRCAEPAVFARDGTGLSCSLYTYGRFFTLQHAACDMSVYEQRVLKIDRHSVDCLVCYLWMLRALTARQRRTGARPIAY